MVPRVLSARWRRRDEALAGKYLPRIGYHVTYYYYESLHYILYVFVLLYGKVGYGGVMAQCVHIDRNLRSALKVRSAPGL